MGDRVTDRERADRRWRRAALILGIVVLSIGCSPLEALYFLWPSDPKFPPECSLVDKGKKETKVVILASASLADPRPETFGAEQDLAERLCQVLTKRYADDHEHVKFVPPYRVRDYNNQNPSQTPYEVGKHFEADRVVYLEISKLELYQRGSGRQLFSGHMEMTVTVTDMSKDREEGPYRKEYIQDFPRTGPICADGNNPALFRSTFLDHVAKDLSRTFTSYTTDDRLEHDNSF
jgi:hypothetical protein